MEGELDGIGWAVTLFADDELGDAFQIDVLPVVVFRSIQEHDDVCVLLNRAGFAQVGKLRLVVFATALLRSTAEL